jgi:hypothetical protein
MMKNIIFVTRFAAGRGPVIHSHFAATFGADEDCDHLLFNGFHERWPVLDASAALADEAVLVTQKKTPLLSCLRRVIARVTMGDLFSCHDQNNSR